MGHLFFSFKQQLACVWEQNSHLLDPRAYAAVHWIDFDGGREVCFTSVPLEMEGGILN